MCFFFVLTLLYGLDPSQHGGSDHKETPGLIKLGFSHDSKGRPQADGHHGRVLEDVMLLAQYQRGDGEREQRGGGVDHLCEGQLDVVQTQVPEGDAGAEGQTQHENFTLGAGGEVPLHGPPVPRQPQFDQPVVHHDGREHVQR